MSNQPLPLCAGGVPVAHRAWGCAPARNGDECAPLARFPGTATAWSAFWRLEPRPGERPPPAGPVAETFEDKFELVAGGQTLAVLPAGDQRTTVRQDLTTVRIEVNIHVPCAA